MSEKFKVHFGKAEHRWMPVEIEADAQEIQFMASSIPCDSLYELAKALIDILTVGKAEPARWNTEPTEYDFIFSNEDDTTKFEIMEYPHSRWTLGRGKVVFSVTDTPQFLALPFWRALREVETRPDLKQDWGYEAPKPEIALLGQLLNR